MPPNDRGYGHWRFAGAFAVVKRQSEMREQNCRNARQPANEHRRVLGAGRWSIVLSFYVLRVCFFFILLS